MARVITENQYMELRRYEDGNPCWVNGGPIRSLLDRGLIRDDGRARNMHVITTAGLNAMRAFRTRYGVS